jgi:hypothetical protein
VTYRDDHAKEILIIEEIDTIVAMEVMNTTVSIEVAFKNAIDEFISTYPLDSSSKPIGFTTKFIESPIEFIGSSIEPIGSHIECIFSTDIELIDDASNNMVEESIVGSLIAKENVEEGITQPLVTREVEQPIVTTSMIEGNVEHFTKYYKPSIGVQIEEKWYRYPIDQDEETQIDDAITRTIVTPQG